MSRLPGGFNDLKSALPLNPMDFNLIINCLAINFLEEEEQIEIDF
jgi:hypothetical protein